MKQLILILILSFSVTADPYRQEDLFDDKGGPCWDGLYQGIDRIRHKYGFRSILWARSH